MTKATATSGLGYDLDIPGLPLGPMLLAYGYQMHVTGTELPIHGPASSILPLRRTDNMPYWALAATARGRIKHKITSKHLS